MKLGDIVWACDRCGAEVVRPAKTDHVPVGWQTMQFPKEFSRDMCPKCIAAFRIFWYRQVAAEALAVAK